MGDGYPSNSPLKRRPTISDDDKLSIFEGSKSLKISINVQPKAKQ